MRRPLLALPLRVWLVLSHGFVLVLPVLALLGTGALGKDLRDQTRLNLENQSALLALMVERELDRGDDRPTALTPDNLASLAPIVGRARDQTLASVRIVDTRGQVVASSSGVLGEHLTDMPEVAEALQGRVGIAVRPRPAVSRSQPLSSKSRRATVRLFVATPITLGDDLVGAVLVSRTPREEVQAIYQMAPRLVVGATAALAITLALAIFYGYLFSRSLRRLAFASEGIAAEPAAAASALEPLQASHIAEVADLATSVRTMTLRLQERLDYIGEFASHVSHEFKTPLATLRGTIELLQDDPEMELGQRALFLRNADEEVQRLDRLVGGLLALARADQIAGRDNVDLNELIDEVIERRHLDARIGDAGTARGDARQLTALVENLVLNARQHGGEQVTVRIVAADDGTGFDVIDDGVGISPNNLARVFDRFFTTERATGGTGLGLALVRAIARAHGGEVSVTSAPGATVFRVRLPQA